MFLGDCVQWVSNHIQLIQVQWRLKTFSTSFFGIFGASDFSTNEPLANAIIVDTLSEEEEKEVLGKNDLWKLVLF